VVARVDPPRPDLDKRFSLALSSGLVASTGALDPFVVVGVALRARIVGPLGIELRGYAPLGSGTLRIDEGEIDTSVWLAGGGLLLASSARRRLSVEAGLGTMAAIVRAAGTTMPPTPQSGGVVAYQVGVAPYARAAVRLRLAAGWSLRLDLIGGTTTPRRPVIALASADGDLRRDLTSWGTVFGGAMGGLEVYF
jgi:hypothetical protein